jgi:serine/threonine-protein kinase HipA
MSDSAVVWCFGRVAGSLRSVGRGGMAFAYDPAWVADGQPPLSWSLPLDGRFEDDRASAFFGGLLPEGQPRDLLARRLGVSVGNDYAMLVALGGDTAGAISILPDGLRPAADADDVEWLDDAGVARVIDEIPDRPMRADDDGEWRLSLAGAQDKLPVVVAADGTIGLTRGGAPSTHILKTPIARLDDTVANEAFCLRLGAELDTRRAGLRTVEAEPIVRRGREALLVRRYDRADDGQALRRLHQEDLCQALGVPTARKYEAEGGPGVADCVAVLRDAASGRAVAGFVDQLVLSFLVGSHDAHGKNFSLLYADGTARATLAPAYDVVSSAAYQRSHGLSRKMAMRFGGEYRPEYVQARHLERLCRETRIGLGPARRRIAGLAERAPATARRVRAEFEERGWDRPVIDRIVSIVDARAERLQRIAA